ncbi:shikimate dehydrogenase family protein [Gaetbulibacter aestuarii]|uniref:Shikimate dehydrogenase n=1 Tax=Gaetbulibacter aestuarii TaxID=1502358 RepID=A0ABW7MYT0_9FLAO
MKKLGLLGKHISYSFSRSYFKAKFEKENIKDFTYQNFDIDTINAFPEVLKTNPELIGLNVTIPYKEEVIPYLDKLDKTAAAIGAVNTIKISKDKLLTGYNTDYYGFKNALQPALKPHHQKAIILGTGGASKAIAYSLEELGISFNYVSRRLKKGVKFTYNMLNESIIQDHQLIVNCTPLGTFPKVDECPEIPYEALTEDHILYDLIYNPEETKFLKFGKQQGATVINGLNMLKLQAEKAWEIWNDQLKNS